MSWAFIFETVGIYQWCLDLGVSNVTVCIVCVISFVFCIFCIICTNMYLLHLLYLYVSSASSGSTVSILLYVGLSKSICNYDFFYPSVILFCHVSIGRFHFKCKTYRFESTQERPADLSNPTTNWINTVILRPDWHVVCSSLMHIQPKHSMLTLQCIYPALLLRILCMILPISTIHFRCVLSHSDSHHLRILYWEKCTLQ